MDGNQKQELKLFIQQLKGNSLVGPLLQNSAKTILNTPESQLNDLMCFKCLQEISLLIQYDKGIKDYIEKVVNNWNNPYSFLCIPAQLQYYFCLGQEVAFFYREKSETINDMCSFVKTQYIDERKVCDAVYDNFLAMLDSVSVMPLEDFQKALLKILRHYKKIPEMLSINSNNEEIHKNLSTLLCCFEHIKMYERESFLGLEKMYLI